MRGTLLILAAVQTEAHAIAAAFAARGPLDGEAVDLPGLPCPARLQLVGLRAVHLASALSHNGVGGLVMAGLAGALDPELRAGDVLIDERSHESLASLPIRRAKIHTAQALIGTPLEKARLFRKTSAAAVEMENAIVRQAAQRRSLPFVGVRAIHDAADQALDPALFRFIDDMGRPRTTAIAAALWRDPMLLPQLTRLSASTQAAARSLGQAVHRAAQHLAGVVSTRA